jgi:hypothetical protein
MSHDAAPSTARPPLVIFGLQPFFFLDELLAPGGVVLGVMDFWGLVRARFRDACVSYARSISEPFSR